MLIGCAFAAPGLRFFVRHFTDAGHPIGPSQEQCANSTLVDPTEKLQIEEHDKVDRMAIQLVNQAFITIKC